MQKDLFIAGFSSYGRLSAGELYLPLTTANIFVEACGIADIAIIGIDFFHVEERYIIPVSPINGLDCSIFLEKNTSWDYIVKKCNEAAIKDLLLEERRDATQWYNPTLFERSEWEQSELNPWRTNIMGEQEMPQMQLLLRDEQVRDEIIVLTPTQYQEAIAWIRRYFTVIWAYADIGVRLPLSIIARHIHAIWLPVIDDVFVLDTHDTWCLEMYHEGIFSCGRYEKEKIARENP